MNPEYNAEINRRLYRELEIRRVHRDLCKEFHMEFDGKLDTEIYKKVTRDSKIKSLGG
jgi:hypothetical protein